jgi:hypothetical protein
MAITKNMNDKNPNESFVNIESFISCLYFIKANKVIIQLPKRKMAEACSIRPSSLDNELNMDG